MTIAGKPCVRIRDERGQPILCPLTRDGRNYLRQSKCWYFKYRDGNGTVRRMKGFADLKSTEQLAAEMERKALGFVSESSTRRMNTPAARSLSI